MSPENVLKRGYSITLLNGRAVKSFKDVKPGDIIRTDILKGQISSVVQSTHNPETMSKEPNYTEAFEELREIVSEMEQGEISVDELSEKVKRAAILIKICQAKLASTEEDVASILKELEKSTDEKG